MSLIRKINKFVFICDVTEYACSTHNYCSNDLWTVVLFHITPEKTQTEYVFTHLLYLQMTPPPPVDGVGVNLYCPPG